MIKHLLKNLFIQLLSLASLLLSIEIIFRLLLGLTLSFEELMQIIILSLSSALFIYSISLIFNARYRVILHVIIISFFIIIAIAQLTYIKYMNVFFTYQLVKDMLFKVSEGFAFEFLKFIPINSVLLFVPLIIYAFFTNKEGYHFKFRAAFVLLFISLSVHLQIDKILKLFENNNSVYTAVELYHQPFLIETSFKELGLITTSVRDILSDQSQFQPVLILPEEETEEVEEIVEVDYSRVIDDSAWIELSAVENNETIKEIDQYLMSKTISPKNEMTGLFAGKNLILMQIEAFDLMAIDEQLTPTLYMMSQNSFYFDQFYAPQFSCTTGDSEFMALTSLIPRLGICSPNTYTTNAFDQNIFEIFNSANYYSSSYHSYSDEFYDRTIWHESMGSDHFYDNQSLEIKTLYGWPSDVNLIEESCPHFVDKNLFFSFIVSASTHFPYDVDSTLGNRYLDTVQSIYPDAPLNIQRYLSKAIEVDKALETLLNELKNDGILENTVIVLYSDHFPLKTSKTDIIENTQQDVDRGSDLNIYKSPFIIYNSTLVGQTISTLSSTIDITPTLANLFGIDYDPRLYFGQDIFDTSIKHTVSFPSYSWISDEGYYYTSKAKFFPNDNIELDDTFIDNMKQKVKTTAEFSYRILNLDYFSNR